MMSPIQRVNVDLAPGMLEELDTAAKELNISRQAVIKTHSPGARSAVPVASSRSAAGTDRVNQNPAAFAKSTKRCTCYNKSIMTSQAFADVPTAIEEIRAGGMIVVVDDEDRENEGDITLAAEKVTPEAINFMAKYGRGLVCLTMTEERLEHLRIGPMSAENTSQYGTAFTESIDARVGVTTGISAYDRARTIQVAIDPATKASDLARPGHVFPLRARKGGVLVRAGQTEASVDLARLAGLIPAGIICEIMKDDGTMARVPDLIEFCQQHNMKMLTVAELIRYRMAHERYVHRVGEAMVDTRFGEFRLIAYESEVEGGESHIALIRGDIENSEAPVLVRMHAHCLMGDVFGATGCECHATLEGSLRRIAQEGRGALIYLHQTSKGFSIEKVGERSALSFHRGRKLPSLLDNERHTQREIGIGAQILSDLNLRKIRLLTNRPKKVAALEGFGIEIVDQVPVELGGVKTEKN
jgi:3,4-dihydroxy 2-butanone 4-phosphate synthase / GTP cyclohydrolase II